MTTRHLSDVGEALQWLRERGVQRLCADSRQVRAGDGFIAWPGRATDARQHVDAACQAGALACLVEADGAGAFAFESPDRVATVVGLKQACGPLASLFEDQPSRELTVVASTGTNGKTSTTWWTAQALSALGQRAAVIGTLGWGEPAATNDASEVPAQTLALTATGLTTPDPVTLQAALRYFVRQGMVACAMEASSIGLAEHRLGGTKIDVALFTNFTQDHLDYHGTMQAYWKAKEALFSWPGLRAAVVNVDDEKGALLAKSLQAAPLDLWTTSMTGPARLQATDISRGVEGLSFAVCEGAQSERITTNLIGDYNVANLLAVVGGLRALGVPLANAASVCTVLTPVPGRMQRVHTEFADQLPAVVVDYAHTPDALEKALLALQPWAAQRRGQLWCVFGCGGNRDPGKRPLMAGAAERHAGHVVLTSDNPRNEEPAEILAHMARGLSDSAAAWQIEDRRQAIERAVMAAQSQDVILLAGKGHEETQEIAGHKYPFSDVCAAQAALLRRAQALEQQAQEQRA